MDWSHPEGARFQQRVEGSPAQQLPSVSLTVTDTIQPAHREWNSEVYHRLSAPQVSWGKKVLGRLHLRGNERILDAGCGTGRLTADLLGALPQGHVVGIDLSQNMLNSAREHLAQYGSRVTLLACDFLHLPFTQAFDGIVSTAAFHWVLDHDRLFANLYRALVPGGFLEAQCGGGPNCKRVRDRADALAASTKFAPYFGGFREPWLFEDAQGAAARLQRAAFVEVETSVQPAPTTLDDARHFNEFVRNIVLRTHLERLPTRDLKDEFMNVLTEQAVNDDPPFTLDYWRLNLRARVP